jgi:DNA-binding MarR family transcriptional regulator
MAKIQKVQGDMAKVSDLESHLGFWLRYVSNHVSQAFATKLLKSDVTVAEWVILREMYGREAVASSALAEFAGLSRGAVSKLVDRLLHKKLLTRVERDDDRRFQSIELTDAGRQLVPRLAALADVNDVEFFSSLSTGERAALLATLRKLVKAHGLKKIPTE